MSPEYSERDLTALQQLLQAIGELNVAYDEALANGMVNPHEGATAPHLARITGYKLDYLKKKLKQLQSAELVEAVSHSPKRYRLCTYHLKQRQHDPAISPFIDSTSPFYTPILFSCRMHRHSPC